MQTRPYYVLLLMVFGSRLLQLTKAQSGGAISFSVDRITTNEPPETVESAPVNIPLQRINGTQGPASVFFMITNSTTDFLDRSGSVIFNDGVESSSGTLFVQSDTVSEGNETFIVEITNVFPITSVVIGSPSTLELTITANDEPHGFVQFSQESLSIVVEENTTSRDVNFKVQRGPGIFGVIYVRWQIIAVSGFGSDDITPVSGEIVFPDRENESEIVVTIRADNFPENDEQFIVNLTSVTGGGMLNSTNTAASLTILGNDSPIRFTQSHYRVDESDGVINITITRGLLEDGSLIGPINVTTTVVFSTLNINGTATPDQDYTAVLRVVTFPPRVTTVTEQISIIDDAEQEGPEIFWVALAIPGPTAELYPPFNAMVEIEFSDNPGGVVMFNMSSTDVTISEDAGTGDTTASFIVERTMGTTGNITIGWTIVDRQNISAAADFMLPNGNITILNEQSQAVLEITPFDDTLPETPEEFTVMLHTIVDGLGTLGDGLIVTVTVRDSDDAYGRIEWGTDNQLRVNPDPRRLELTIARNGGSEGEIIVEYSIIYLPPGVSDPSMGTASVFTNAAGSITMMDGEAAADIQVDITPNAFLEQEGSFWLNLTRVLLSSTSDILPTSELSSPRIGLRSAVLISVPPEAANGRIRFATQSVTVTAIEPEIEFTAPVDLVITRSGFSGTATVFWRVLSSDPDFDRSSDIVGTAGQIMISSGSNNATLTLAIQADDVPEIAETFQVELYLVNEANQQISITDNTSTITILHNDDPDGIFQFSNNSMRVVNESNRELITLEIERSGGSVSSVGIQYRASPIGQTDLFGATGLVTFSRGVTLMRINIIAAVDGIPEIDEMFMVQLSQFDGGTNLLGNRTTVNITILKNDDANGVFSFAQDSLQIAIAEIPPGFSGDTTLYRAVFTVQRARGRFGDVLVNWTIVNATSDVSPTEGVLMFRENDAMATFTVYSTPDNIPEINQPFIVALEISGDGRLDSVNTEAELIILQNDDPIFFARSFARANEGERLAVRVERNGQAIDTAIVTFSLSLLTAMNDDVNLTSTNEVIFMPGQREAEIFINITDDDTPELIEQFTLELINTTGDAVISRPTNITIEITANDDPYGVFLFSVTSLDITEGSGRNELRVNRSRGVFGNSTLTWGIFDSLGWLAMLGLDFSTTSGLITFVDGETYQSIEFNVIDDTEPELMELFEFRLLNVTAGRLDSSGTVAMVTVLENDDPYGAYEFETSLREVEIPEDIPLGGASSVDIQVDRSQGTFGEVTVVWEILPYSGANVPTFTDLLLVSTPSSLTASTGRPDTNTTAYQFDGQNSTAIVMEDYLPRVDGSFSVSMWLMPTASGLLMLKRTLDGILSLLSISLTSTSGSYQIQIDYAYQTSTVITAAIPSSDIAQSYFEDGSFHHVVVTVNGTHVNIYLDGVSIVTRTLNGPILDASDSEFIIGGGSFVGMMQDVRYYSTALSTNEILLLFGDDVADHVTPITGYLVYSNGTMSQNISVMSKDDNIPEPSTPLVVLLGSSNNRGRITARPNSQASLTVLKSDRANGEFTFAAASLSPRTYMEGQILSYEIERSGGTFGYVSVTWEVQSTLSSNDTVNDFTPFTNEVEFEPQTTSQNFTVTVTNDDIPELDETFSIVLVSAIALDNETSSTETSGASILASGSRATITIAENDYPYGLMQFATSPPPSSGNPFVPAATVAPVANVMEEDGTITLYVVRAQGTVGSVSVEYQTLDGNATSLGVRSDYQDSVGTLNFPDGTQVQNISITLNDDGTPELLKQFTVQLRNPQGSPAPLIGVAGQITVQIAPSDDAFGVFSFTTSSLAQVVEEAPRADVTFTVQRMGGALGPVLVHWQVTQFAEDVSPPFGNVSFETGQTENTFSITVLEDQLPELAEVVTIALTSVTGGGRLSSTGITEAMVTIQASDDPYGVFSFPGAFRPLHIDENISRVNVLVSRLFGVMGRVAVQYATLSMPPRGTNRDPENLATAELDYMSAVDKVIFEVNQTSANITLDIINDNLPELNESIYIRITGANLLLEEGSGGNAINVRVDTNSAVAEIIIAENDDARGIIEFSSTTINTTEPNAANYLTVTRSAGAFGQITVDWTTSTNTASFNDFTPAAAFINIPNGQNRGMIPLNIIDDDIPEFSETFTVHLISVLGGARLGNITSTTVTILPNDDPYGALEFSGDSRTLMEPVVGSTSVSLTVDRNGGTTGIVSARWEIIRSNGLGMVFDDIRPTSGSVQFGTGMAERTILLEIQSDNIPEDDEVFLIQLSNSTGGARIDSNFQLQLTISANDNPYGTIMFFQEMYPVIEGRNAILLLQRSFGIFGDLRVWYTERTLDLTIIAERIGMTASDYFSSPVADITITASSTGSLTNLGSNASSLCLSQCLSQVDCQSFVLDTAGNSCVLFAVARTNNNTIISSGTQYYEKDNNLVRHLIRSQASSSDFRVATNASTTIFSGNNSGEIFIAVMDDSIPELNETFIVELNAVEVIGRNVLAGNEPQIGMISSASVVILENDDAHGEFYLYVNTNMATISVPEANEFSVPLTIQRMGGAIGDVTIAWRVTGGLATAGEDYRGASIASFTFRDGVRMFTTTITILEDDIPERNEDIVVQLTGVTGGGTIADDGSSVTIIIMANDRAAGVVGFPTSSRSVIASEGELVTLTVSRIISSLGRVEITWEVTGVNAGNEFANTTGNALFEEGDNTTTITLGVLNDVIPEIAEPYNINIVSVMTLSADIPSTGAATIDQLSDTATVTIRASNNPHGIVELQMNSLNVTIDESTMLDLTIVREFGSIDAVRVSYEAEQGSLVQLTDGQTLATANEDFNPETQSVVLEDGVASIVIRVPIIDDAIPELSEVFVVRLTAIELVNNTLNTVPPSLGSATVAQVEVNPNDNPQGVITFEFATNNVSEDVGQFNLTVLRTRGTFGEVSVLYGIINLNANAMGSPTPDYTAMTSGMLTFANNVSEQVIPITIIQDDIPETDEYFQVQLISPTGDAILGGFNTTVITIEGNDDENGVFSFNNSTSIDIAVEESEIASLEIVRMRGLFGRITVLYEVESNGSEDLSIITGGIVFEDGIRSMMLELTALLDNIPELDETYYVQLTEVIGGGRLDSLNTIANVTILANQNPYGVFELITAGVNSSVDGVPVVLVEENQEEVTFLVHRSFGTFGEVNVTWGTEELNAAPGLDYLNELAVLTFEEGEANKTFTVILLEDDIPEVLEAFRVSLSAPTGGAMLGETSSITVGILTNDNAHGIIGFSTDSLSVITMELLGGNGAVELIVQRRNGTFGEVRVNWELSGDHNGTEVNPPSGEVIFVDMVTEAAIRLVIQSDNLPELTEITQVALTEITADGVDMNEVVRRGAVIDQATSIAVISVIANDFPHGQIRWVSLVIMIEEPNTTMEVELTLIRESGAIGDIIISYSTVNVTALMIGQQRALDGEDYIFSSGTVSMAENITTASVRISILPDDTPEILEVFIVRITNVTLANGNLGEDSLSPRPLPGDESVQIQIGENDNARGILNFDVDLNFEGTVGVQENVRTFSVTVTRSAGTTGMVGCTVATTPISAQGEGVDYLVNEVQLEFMEGQNSTVFTITINNDAIPELEETFEVSITDPTGGARIGGRNTFTTTILRNDDVNGVFTFALDTLVLLVPESMPGSGEEAIFRVVRSRSFAETVVVQWAVSNDGRDDLKPDNGTLVFPENVTEQVIMIRAVHDNQPEPSEGFTISLLSATNSGRISAPFSASIVISASDDPMGVLGLAPYPTGIVISEGEDLTIMVVRSAGTLGEVSAVWRITPMDNNTFQIVTDTVVLTNGQQTAIVTVPTLEDSNPEIARHYAFSLVASEQAPLDPNATEVTVIVASSDHPHGTIQFQAPLSQETQEGSGVLSIPVQRNAGLSGDIRVNYSLNPLSAVAGSDYISTQSSFIIGHNTAVGEILVTIINDQDPELDETFTITLTSVELLNSFDDLRGFTFAGDSIIDMPPTLGANNELEVVILENDDARGVVSLDASVFAAVEGRTAYINMTRSGGMFGEIGIRYQITNGSARGNGQDYNVLSPQGEIVIIQGQTVASILVPIVDDTLPELQEQFFVELTGATGGASLAGITTATVIIEPSDDPSGVIRFSVEDQSRAPIQNPFVGETPLPITYTVERIGGTIGTTEVQWRVTGPIPGRESNDIDPETLQGLVTFTAGQSSGSIEVRVLPDNGPEAEEVFIIQLVAVTEGAVIDPSADIARLTISQRGNPFGTVGFVGEALQPQNFAENPNTPVNVSLPIGRSGGNTGNILVFFVVEGPMDIQSDISPVNGSVLIQDGEVRASIDITILSEDIPEMEEAFTVVITRIEGGAEPSTDRRRSTFTVGSNDAPHGLFVVGSAAVAASVQGSSITRQLGFTVSRQFGNQGTVEITISMYYDQLPGARYVPETSTVTFLNEEQEQVLNIPIALDAFLSFGAAFNISITSARLVDPSESDSTPEISNVFGSTSAMITEQVANPLVGFNDVSIEASVNDAVTTNNVQLIVNRFGQVGTISLLWQAGSSQLVGVENGSIIPATGRIEMQPTALMATIILTVVARIPHGVPEVFSVQLSAVSQISGFAAGVRREAAVSTIEPYGVVQLDSMTSYLGIEGEHANITVWRRFSSRGDIMVTGVASAVSQVGTNQSPAQAVIDFPVTPLTTIISDGMTIGTITIQLGNDNNIGSPKVFRFNLTSVERVPAVESQVSSPRLASSSLSSLVVIADDEGGSGIFQFTSSGSMVAENGSPLVQAIIARGGGNFGRVEVLVRTIDGRAGTSTSSFQTARSGLDYQPYSETLVFESGQIEQSIILRVLDDDVPEILEYFTVELTNPSGGALLASNARTFEVSIGSNDDPNGIFSLTPSTIQLDEERSPVETISVVREPGLFGMVQINWRTVPDPEFSHSVNLDDLLVVSFGSILFQPNMTTASIELQLRPNSVPENGEQFIVEIFSSQSGISITGTTAMVTVLPAALSVFQFAQASRVIVVTNANTAVLQVERIRGIPITGEVSIFTQSLNSVFTYEGITIQPAVGAEHYATTTDTIRMDSGESTRDFSVPLINIQSVTVFRGFYVQLDAANRPNTQVQNEEALVVLAPPVEGMLLRLYIQLQQATNIFELESVANSLANVITQGQLVGSNTQSSLVQLLLDGVSSAVEANNLQYSTSLRNTLLDIYNIIFTSETFRHQSQFFTSLQQFGYSLLTGSVCPRTESLFYTRSSFYMEVTYTTSEALQGKQFLASRDPSFSDVRDYLTLPSTPVLGLSDCVRVNFLTLRNQTIFFTPTPNLRGISLSIGIQNYVITGTSPVTYRIYSSSDGTNLNVTRQECLRFEFPASTTSAGRWVVDDSCSPVQLENGAFPRDYVECQCTTFGEFAARREAVQASLIVDRDDDKKRWLPSGPIPCGAVMIVMLLIVILHVVYFQRMQQPTKIFTNLCISIFLFQAITLVNILITDSASQTGCTVLGILTQLTVIAQFGWIMALTINFWMTFLGYSEGKEPLIGFILVVWAIPVLLVVVTILVVRFSYDDEINGEIYGRDFDTTYYLCYMPNHWVALVSTALPIILCLMCTVLLLSHSCIYWGQWEQYDDMYYYSYNYREVPRVLVFFLLITLTWIFGSLHVYLGQVYLLVLFEVFNYLQAIYALVVYFILSWRTLLKKQQSYSPKNDVIPLQTALPPVAQQSLAGPITNSTRNLLTADQLQDEWDNSRHGSVATDASSTQSRSKRRVVTPPVDNEDSQLDDIMFMLKTGGSYSLDEGARESYATNATDETETKPSSSEHYELRRISIADTHV